MFWTRRVACSRVVPPGGGFAAEGRLLLFAAGLRVGLSESDEKTCDLI